MTVFQYKAADVEGKTIRGTLEADGEQAVVAKLHDMGWVPISIAPASRQQTALNLDLVQTFRNLVERVSNRDLLVFTEDMAGLLSAGLPVDRSLAILIDVTVKEKFRTIIQDVLKRVQGGSYLSDALAHHPHVFSEFYVNMIRAGEAGGVQDAILQRLAGFLSTSQELRDYIRSALIYPGFLVLASGISIIILITYVIPKFSLIFADMGDAMPVYTRLLLSLGEVLKGYWWLMAGGFIGFVAGIRRYARTPAGRLTMDRLMLKTPLLGETVVKIEVSRFARTLGTLITSGVPILHAIQLVGDILGNRVVAKSMERVHDRVKEGERLSSPLHETGFFPSLAVQMITVGEETGRLAEMLIRVADNYERLVRNLVQRLIGLLEPALILIMGLLVGFIVIAMLAPIFSMNELPF